MTSHRIQLTDQSDICSAPSIRKYTRLHTQAGQVEWNLVESHFEANQTLVEPDLGRKELGRI
jgi:hypothetical protein